MRDDGLVLGEPEPQAERAHERREDLVWSGLLLGVLALCLVPVVTGEDESAGERVVTVAIALACAGWQVGFTALAVPGRNQRREVVHAAGLVAFLVVLVERSQAFEILVYALYPQLFLRLGWAAIPVIAGATAWGLSRAELPADELVLRVGLSTALAVGIAVSIDAVDRLSRRREATITALERARAEVLERGRTIGVLQERERLARELHDTIAQGLVSVVAQLEAAEQALQAGRGDDAADRVVRARSGARASLDDARRAVAALRPDLLVRGGGLAAGLGALAGTLREDGDVGVAVTVEGDATMLDPGAEDELLRCAQEALANVRRHASARNVAVELRVDGASAELVVRDDGRGFDTGAGTGGFGLVGLRERAVALGGELAVGSVPGAGTEVRVRVPAPVRRPHAGPARTDAVP